MDGFFNGRRLFNAPHNGAVLVSGDRLRNPQNVNILDEDPTFSIYGFPSHLDRYPDDYSLLRHVCSELMQQKKCLFRFRCREHDPINIPVSTPAVQSEGIIVPVTRLESNSNSNNSNISFNRPVIREIPIKIVPATTEGRNHTMRMSRPTSSSSVVGKFPVNDTDEIFMSLDANQSHQSQQKADINTKVSLSEKPLYDNVASGTSFLKDSSRSLSGTRPAKLPVAAETVRLKSNDGGLVEGDRVVWFDAMGIPRRGTARWIGYLRGHTNIYVGVDFY
ncbi:unnamed protein product [Onchocerca flexuosa]|uniref:Uncharacterized protein n=1 Tax=Onchocerca flexuosa TaxID=387005 RepID=A0A183HMZ3_9BILA|nr:unnamed protein product [Onchocerca flexuosa]